LEITEKRTDQYTILKISGRLDAANSYDFENKMLKLIEDGVNTFLMDFSALDYISSSGLRVFLVSAKKIENTNGKIVIFAAKPNVKDVFQITGFSTLFPMFNSLEEAKKNLETK